MLLGVIFGISALVAAVICGVSGAFSGLAWLWLLPVSFLGSVVLLALAGFAFLLILCKRVDQSVPQEDDDPLYRKVTDLYLAAILPVLRIRTIEKGMEKVPGSGRFLLVCNHTDDSDPIILLHSFAKYQLAFISKRENSSMFVIGPMMHKLQCQLINRENDREALKTILKCIQILKEDKASVAVFPEGGIHDDYKFHHFRPGVFKIAQKAKVPIVVCTLKNTTVVIPNIKRLRGSTVELNVLDVIQPEEFAEITTVELADRIYKMMAADLGPGLVAVE